MPRLTIDITDELANELLSRRVDAVGVCLTALQLSVNSPKMTDSPKIKATRRPGAGRPTTTESGDKLKWRSIGLEPADWTWLKAEADKAGTTTNDVIRKMIRDARAASDG